MEKIKKRIANLKVAGKLKVYRMTVLVMTLFLVLVALISTLVIRSNIEKITEVWSPVSYTHLNNGWHDLYFTIEGLAVISYLQTFLHSL